MSIRKLTRREFFRATGIGAGAVALSACTPQVVTQVITQIVPQAETQLVEVEKMIEVTPTPPPAQVTLQGRELPADAAPLDQQIFRFNDIEPKFLDTARDIYSAGTTTNCGNEPLLRNNENMETVPALAESWKPSETAEYWEFTIREGAAWSDGTPITSDDVIYTFKHLSDPKLANPWVWFFNDIKDVAKHSAGEITGDEMKSVEKVDDRTFRLYGEYGPIPYLPALMSYQAAVLAPKHKAEADPEHWADTIEKFVSSGPYIPTKWEHNKEIVWELNPTYNGPHKPAITKFIGVIFAPDTPYFNSLMNKEIDLKHILEPSEVAAIRADPKLNPHLHFFNNFQSSYVALNTNMPPLDNKAFRQALAHSIDRVTLCGQVLNGTAVPGYSMLPPGFPAYNEALQEYQKFDLDLAKAKLAESGVDPASVTIDLYQYIRFPDLEFVKQQWETNLGIKVNLNMIERGVWGDRRTAHDMQAYRGPYEYDFLDPSNMLTGLWRSVTPPEGKSEPWGSPRHAWKNEQFDKLVTDAGSEVDAAKRIKMFQDAEQILVEDVGAVFLTHQIVFQFWWPWITGMHPDKTGNVVFRWLDIARFQMYIRADVDQLKQEYM